MFWIISGSELRVFIREFKAVIQDVSHIYLGAQMTVSEMVSYEDVPFKVKAVFNKYFGDDNKRERKICDLLGELDEKSFEYQVAKQLRLKIKAGVYREKKGEEVYKSQTLNFQEYLLLYKSEDKFFVEEIVFNKLALLAFST